MASRNPHAKFYNPDEEETHPEPYRPEPEPHHETYYHNEPVVEPEPVPEINYESPLVQ